MHRRLLIGIMPSALAVVAILAGCGTGGGNEEPPAMDDVVEPPLVEPRPLGERVVPGGTVRVVQLPSAEGTVTLRIELLAFTQEPVAISVAAGGDFDSVALVAAERSVDATWTLTLPVVIRPSEVRVRLAMADGAVIETGGGDFPLE